MSSRSRPAARLGALVAVSERAQG